MCVLLLILMCIINIINENIENDNENINRK